MNPRETPLNFEPPAPPAASAPDPLWGPVAKRPGVAVLLALFPGLGHIYDGLYLRGLTIFLVFFSLVQIITHGYGLAGLALAFTYLFNVLDAWRQAKLINYGYAQDLGLVDLPRHPHSSQGGVVAGVLRVLLGVIALLDRFFSIDLDWLVGFWPVALIGLGGWLIWGSILDRRDRRREAEG